MPATLRRDQLADLDQAFGFNRSANAQVASGWFLLVIRNGYQPGYQRLEEYLASTGRSSLIVPLYAELDEDAGRRHLGEARLRGVEALLSGAHRRRRGCGGASGCRERR